MISAIANGLSNSTLANIAQNTAASVSIETSLKAMGRPGFILIDNDIKPETKNYAAAKEFLYQATCLAIYLAVITPIFKNGAFYAGKKIFKNSPEFAKFNSAKDVHNYFKYASKGQVNRRHDLRKLQNRNLFSNSELYEDLRNKKVPPKYPLVKGVVELGSLIGSVIGLAIVAPQISHHTIHPMMKYLGFEKKDDAKAVQNDKQLDTNA